MFRLTEIVFRLTEIVNFVDFEYRSVTLHDYYVYDQLVLLSCRNGSLANMVVRNPVLIVSKSSDYPTNCT